MAPTTVFLVLCLFTHVVSQGDHPMLIENCNWPREMALGTRGTNEVIPVATPTVSGHDLAPNVVCRVNITIVDAANKLKLTVRKFDLKGTGMCTSLSERMALEIETAKGIRQIVWCGQVFAEEMYLPSHHVSLVYNSGAHGEGNGFEVAFTAVKPSTCQDSVKMDISIVPRLLYSPGYPDVYSGQQKCSVEIHAPDLHVILIRSREMELESSSGCQYDYLEIEDEKFCGQEVVDVVVRDSPAQISFTSDSSRELSGFVLEYVAVPATELRCSKPEHTFIVTATGTESVVYLQNSYNDNPLRCHVKFDSGSSDLVLSLTLPPEHGHDYRYNITIGAENKSATGQRTLISDSREPHAIERLLTPGRDLEFYVAFLSDTASVQISVQAVPKGSLPPTLSAKQSLLWINFQMSRTELRVMGDRVDGEHIKISVYKAENWASQELDKQMVSDFVTIYNGPNNTHFELTRDCNGALVRETEIYAINSDYVTIAFENYGFWLWISQSSAPDIVYPSTLPMLHQFKPSNDLKLRNLHCRWIIDVDDEEDKVIRMKASNNFAFKDNSFIVEEQITMEARATLKSFTKYTVKDLWLYSRNPIVIDVSITNLGPKTDQATFEFSYEIVSMAGLQMECSNEDDELVATETVQYATTPNFPHFYMRHTMCTWVIRLPEDATPNSKLAIDFPNLNSNYKCNDEIVFQVYTGKKRSRQFVADLCDHDRFTQMFKEDTVTIEFMSMANEVQPGFGFSYYYITQSVTREISCNTTVSLPNEELDIIQGIGQAGRDVICTYTLMLASSDLDLKLEVVDINFHQQAQGTECTGSQLRIYQHKLGHEPVDQPLFSVDTLCGLPQERKVYLFSGSPVRIEAHLKSDGGNIFPNFKLKFSSHLTSCEGVKLKATSGDGYLTSPSFPQPYPRFSECMWYISAEDAGRSILIDFEEFTLPEERFLQCQDGYVEIRESSVECSKSDNVEVYCGVVRYHQYESKSSQVTIRFKAGSVGYRGFRFRFSQGGYAQTKKCDDPHLIIGLVTASALIVIVAVIICICLLRRKQRLRQQRRASNRASQGGFEIRHITHEQSGRNQRIEGTRNYPGVAFHIDGQEPSVFILNPVIINARDAPPSYAEVTSPDYYRNPPPYSTYDTRMGHPKQGTSRGSYRQRWKGNESNDNADCPPPYSPDMPGGPMENLAFTYDNNMGRYCDGSEDAGTSRPLAAASVSPGHVTRGVEQQNFDQAESRRPLQDHNYPSDSGFSYGNRPQDHEHHEDEALPVYPAPLSYDMSGGNQTPPPVMPASLRSNRGQSFRRGHLGPL